MIEKGKNYKYKELCLLMNESPKTGESKKSQLRRWSLQFDWDNPTKQTFHITEIHNPPKTPVENRGGIRVGAGAKQKLKSEFDYLFKAYCDREWMRTVYYLNNPHWKTAYFTSSEIATYFGLHDKQLYSAQEDEKTDKSLLKIILKKIYEKKKGWIIDKIKKLDWVTYSRSVLAYDGNCYSYHDDWAEERVIYQSDYMKLNNFSNVGMIVESGLWNDMELYITNCFNERILSENESAPMLRSVKYVHKVEYQDYSHFDAFDLSTIYEYKQRYNSKLILELYKYLLKREKPLQACKYIIENYVRMTCFAI